MASQPHHSDRPVPDTVIRLRTFGHDEALHAVGITVAQHRNPLVVNVASDGKPSTRALLKRLVARGAQTCEVSSRLLSDLGIHMPTSLRG